MKIRGKRTSIFNYGNLFDSILQIPFFLIAMVEAQASSSPDDNRAYPSFSPAIAIIVVVIIAALFLMAFFSIYIRHHSDSSGAATAGRILSLRSRRTAAARGLDKSVLETFPTFSYSEVKDHQIGKGVLECAVCLNEFEDDETLRLLPKCDHVFHPDCIDAWLESHVTCPVCRAYLVPQEADDPVQATVADENTASPNDDSATSNSIRETDVVIQVVDGNETGRDTENRNQSEKPERAARSWSLGKPKGLSLSGFRSHSTGHPAVQPTQNLERFTLRVPAEVRKEVMERAVLNRARSLAVGLAREGSWRRGNRSASSRWAFFTRALSIRSPKVAAERGESSTSMRTPVKMASFKPKTGNSKDESPV